MKKLNLKITAFFLFLSLLATTACSKEVGASYAKFVGGNYDITVYSDIDRNGIVDRPQGDQHAMPYKSMVPCKFIINGNQVVTALVPYNKFLEVKHSNLEYLIETSTQPFGSSNYDSYTGQLTGTLFYSQIII